MHESKIKSPEMDDLFAAIRSLPDEESCYRFFEDLCTIGELLAMKQRFEVVRELKRGETYSVIAQKTGASTATISRVNRCLSYGTGGYEAAIAAMEDNKD